MLDIRFVRENPDIVKENIKKKFQDAKLPLVDQVLALDEENRVVQTRANELRSVRNSLSKQVGILMGQAKKDPSKLAEAEAAKAQVKANADELAQLEVRETELAAQIRKIMLVNPPSFSSLKQAPCKDNKLFKYFIELPIFGTLIYHMVASRESISSLFMEKLFYNPFHVTDTLVDTYYESAHKGGSNAKYLYSSYIGKYLNISINNAVESSDACIYIISGEKEASASLIAEEYQKLNSSIETAVIPETRHLPHLEDPEHFLEQVAIFL